MYKRILIPSDGSDTADAGLREGFELARQLGAQVRVIHVVDDQLSMPPEFYGVTFDDITDSLREVGRSILNRAKGMIRDGALAVETQLYESQGLPVGQVIVDAAKDWSADLIVCGTHGRRGLRRMVMGSDAEFIVRHSPVPVLLTRVNRE